MNSSLFSTIKILFFGEGGTDGYNKIGNINAMIFKSDESNITWCFKESTLFFFLPSPPPTAIHFNVLSLWLCWKKWSAKSCFSFEVCLRPWGAYNLCIFE